MKKDLLIAEIGSLEEKLAGLKQERQTESGLVLTAQKELKATNERNALIVAENKKLEEQTLIKQAELDSVKVEIKQSKQALSNHKLDSENALNKSKGLDNRIEALEIKYDNLKQELNQDKEAKKKINKEAIDKKEEIVEAQSELEVIKKEVAGYRKEKVNIERDKQEIEKQKTDMSRRYEKLTQDEKKMNLLTKN